MPAVQDPILAGQVRALRRQNRLMILLFGALLCTAMAIPQQGGAPDQKVLRADRVEAKEFLIRGEKGVRANLVLQDDGSIGFYLRDAGGTQRLALLAQNDGVAGVVVNDAKGRERISVLSHDKGSGIYLLDHEERERMSLLTQPDELAGMFLMDTGKRERVSLLTQPNGVGGVVVRAVDGEAVHNLVQ